MENRQIIQIGICSTHIRGVRAVHDGTGGIGHHDGVDVLNPGDGAVEVIGEHLAVGAAGQHIGYIGRLGQHQGGVHQIPVQVVILHAQREGQSGGHPQHGSRQNQEQT